MADSEKKNPVAEPTAQFNEMKEDWTLITDLKGGSKTMRAAKDKYLPKEEKESANSFENRLKRSFLFNGYEDTVSKLSTKPFTKPVKVDHKDNLHEMLDMVKDDADLAGTTLPDFAKQLFEDGVDNGKFHILVDFPPKEEDENRSKADEKALGIRPIFIRVHSQNLIGWQTERNHQNKEVLSQIRIQETRTEKSGDYGTQEVEYIRVYGLEKWEIWKKVKAGTDEEDWVMESDGDNHFGVVPLITGYFRRTGFLTAKPALYELAELNLQHYQSSSEQTNILRFARIFTHVFMGVSTDEGDTGWALGSGGAVILKNPEAKAMVLEHSGKAIEAGRQDIMDIQERMEMVGLQPLLRNGGSQTATAKGIDESKNQAKVTTWIQEVESCLLKAYKMAAEWITKAGQVKVEIPKDFAVTIFKDFVLSFKASENIRNLIEMRKIGEISRPTFLRLIRKHGLLDDDINLDEEIQRIEQEGPSLGLIGEDEDDDE